MQKSGNVAIFWDYENCPAPASTSGYAIANSVSTLARRFGSVKLFKAYLEISDQSRSMALRSELQSSGVSLVDCPHNGRKDVADKMLLVDMLAYAIDNHAPATILLITGDRDFAYALSVLKNRHYRVVLVKRPDTHVSLTFQASVYFDWFDDVVHQAENPTSQTEQRPQQQPSLRHRQAAIRNSSASPASSTTEDLTVYKDGIVDIGSFLRGRLPDRLGLPVPQDHPQVSTPTSPSPRQDREISSPPRRRKGLSFSSSRDSTSNSASLPQNTSDEAPKQHITQSDPPCTAVLGNTLPNIKDNQAVRDDGLLYSTRLSRSADAKSTETFQKLPVLESTKEEMLSSASPLVWPALSPPTPVATAQRVVYEEGRSVKAILSPGTPVVAVEKIPKNEQTNIINPKSLNLIRSPALKPSISAVNTTYNLKPGIAEVPVGSKVITAKPAAVSSDNDPRTASAASRSTAPPVVPHHFVVLVEALQWQRSQGVIKPLRGVIAEKIGKNGRTYQKAGVTSFRGYSLLAEEAGIVDMGGIGGRDWIRLLPRWHGVHVSPTLHLGMT